VQLIWHCYPEKRINEILNHLQQRQRQQMVAGDTDFSTQEYATCR
jgi:hypothetical protein